MTDPSELLRAVLEPRRRAILRELDAAGGLPVGELAKRFDVSRPAISQHLAVLRAAGLVRATARDGRTPHAVVPEALADARQALAALAAELPGAAAGPADPADVTLEVAIGAPPATLYALATTAGGLGRWLGVAEVDARPGGTYRVDLGGDVATGTFRTLEPPALVVFGWGQDGGVLAPDSSTVELRLAAAGDRRTHVRLTHRGLPEDLRVPHLAAWAPHLARLAQAATAP